MKKIILLPFLLAATSGCMKQQTAAISSTADTAMSGVGCESQFQSKVFDSMYAYLDQEQQTPDLEELKLALAERIDQVALAQDIQDTETLNKFKDEYGKIFEIMINDPKKKDIKEHLQTLMEMEMGDKSSTENVQLNNKIASQFSKVSELSNELNIACSQPEEVRSTPPEITPAATMNRMMLGMNNVVTTAYQSCKVLEVPVMTEQTPDVEGIERFGEHADGIGGKRRITSVAAVQRTHPYIKVAGNVTSSSCFNVYQNPLIYDYGGAPAVVSNTLNFHKNAGSGEAVLGIDCSALVASAAAAGGLRYKPGVENKAIFVRYASAKFIDATTSNFTCYNNITLTKTDTIKPGDIAAVKGHVVMIDRVGADPFGFKKFTNVSQCSSIDYKNFDFTVTQSSPSKEGSGINKYVAKDYLGESFKMMDLFTNMGKVACEAYFKNYSVKPKSTEWGIIRHKGTTECIAPKIKMVNQSCVSSCQL